MENMSPWERYGFYRLNCNFLSDSSSANATLQVEAVLSVSPYVDNIMMHADPFHSYCVALVVASQSTLEELATKRGIAFTDVADLCEKEETIKEVQTSLVKACLSRFDYSEFVMNFVLRSRGSCMPITRSLNNLYISDRISSNQVLGFFWLAIVYSFFFN